MAKQRKMLNCTGADGVQRPFEYEVDKSQFSNEWYFRVCTSPTPTSGQFFECNVKEVDPQTVRVIAIAHHGLAIYVAKGIPDAILPEIAARLGMEVVSSSNLSGHAGVWRTPDAEKVWKRSARRR